jgi:hypothetical protein
MVRRYSDAADLFDRPSRVAARRGVILGVVRRTAPISDGISLLYRARVDLSPRDGDGSLAGLVPL